MADRILLIGAEDVERAGRNISGAADVMQRAAESIDRSSDLFALRMEQVVATLVEHDAEVTLRDEFAMRAMARLINGPAAQNICDRDPRYDETNFAHVVAVNAYEFADAMLKVRQSNG